MTSLDANQNSTSNNATLNDKINIDTTSKNKILKDDNDCNDAINNNNNKSSLFGLKQNYFSLDIDNLKTSSDDNVNNNIKKINDQDNLNDNDNLSSKLNDEDGNLIDLTQLHNDINSITSKLINLNDCLVNNNDVLNLEKVIINSFFCLVLF